MYTKETKQKVLMAVNDYNNGIIGADALCSIIDQYNKDHQSSKMLVSYDGRGKATLRHYLT